MAVKVETIPGASEVADNRKQIQVRGSGATATAALKSALIALILDDEDVRDAIRSCLPDATTAATTTTTTPAAELSSIPELPDAERAKFITDLIEGYVGRHIRPDALRRPLR